MALVQDPMGFSDVSGGKESACNAGDAGLTPGEDSLEKKRETHSSILA